MLITTLKILFKVRLRNRIENYINLEVFSGFLLLLGIIIALLFSNTSLHDQYQNLIKLPVGFNVGEFSFQKTLVKWVNDGLMAVFFLFLTLEVKFHSIEGQLNSKSTILLPVIAALGGAIVPVIVYYFFTKQCPPCLNGWAITIATDTAFVLAILAFFAARLPLSAKLFVVALSVIDDIIAVLVMAFFYTPSLHLMPLLISMLCLMALALLNILRVRFLTIYLLFGLLLWAAVVESGIHGTLAGVLLGIFIPINSDGEKKYSPLKNLENALHPIVALLILPIFAFLNSGVSFSQLNFSDIFSPITLGISAGLFFGKQIGIMGFTFLSVRLGFCKLPSNLNWQSYYAISILCGIGFTFSLFIGFLAFNDAEYLNQMRIGVLIGSLASCVLGAIILRNNKRIL